MSESSKISEAVFLAVISSLLYAMAFAYRLGYASHFGLPSLLPSPSLGTILESGGDIVFIVTFYWFIAYFSWPFFPQGNSTSDRRIRIVLTLIFIASLFVFQFSDSYFARAFGNGALLLFFAFLFRRPMFLPLYTAQERIDERVSYLHPLTGRLSAVFGIEANKLILTALLVIIFAYQSGLKSARSKTEYFILPDRPGFVVAAMEEETIILASYDPKTFYLTGMYKVEKLSDSRAWTFQKRQTGKLLTRKTDMRRLD